NHRWCSYACWRGADIRPDRARNACAFEGGDTIFDAVEVGRGVALQSRCTDETGYVQPTREQLISVRGLHAGPDGFNHYNGIKTWFVHRDGKVSHVYTQNRLCARRGRIDRNRCEFRYSHLSGRTGKNGLAKTE